MGKFEREVHWREVREITNEEEILLKDEGEKSMRKNAAKWKNEEDGKKNILKYYKRKNE